MLRLVLVRWLDAWCEPEPGPVEGWAQEYPVSTVGYLVREGERVISIAAEVLPPGEGYRAVSHIPRVLITEIVELMEFGKEL